MKRAMMMGPVAMLALAGCVTDREKVELEPPTAAGDTIRFTAGRCFGACPAYTLRVTPDGSGLLEPERFTSVPGPTRFTVSAAQYRQLRTGLAPWKPATGTARRIAQGENCARFATDMPSSTIEWTRGDGKGGGKETKPTRLDFQSGCMDSRYAKLRTTIGTIPKMLGIEPMLKPKPAS